MTGKLSLPQARRIALLAQGLAKVRSATPVTARAVDRTFSRLQLVQIDSVNVLSRSHLLPFFSRLGNYETNILTTMAQVAPRKMMEYWAHEASFIRPLHFHDLRVWQNRTWMGAAKLEPSLRHSLEGRIMALLENHRFLTAREMTALTGHEENNPRDAWGWNWSAVKRILEGLFERGLISAAGRNEQFERQYALTSSVLPAAVSRTVDAAPEKSQALLRLITAAAAAHGVGTVRCFADYFRLPVRESAAAVETLVRQGVLLPVAVDGWDGRVFLHHEASLPRAARARALLSPFDSLVFERRRLEQLFNFHYRLEIYTPEAKRRYGYYVLPFLLGENMVARVDLKADRQARTLLVRGAYAEPHAPAHTSVELAAELQLMAQWLGLGQVQVQPRGDLAPALHAALG
ncbi:winged helix-turn-helix domain-containing protein [Specibacter sp. NPDC057265]|uniref:winged helix-turn-helix domain-containing protein n=1 Tax=Specibacter sp. NPDC057265 TaxID=3346075 RepID=UPI00362AF060